MKRQEVEYSDGELTARVIVTAANVLQGMKRSRLKFEAGDMKDSDADTRLVRLVVYPELLAAATLIEINGVTGDPAFADFIQLPEAFVKQWEDAAYACNPHWLPDETDEKKESN